MPKSVSIIGGLIAIGILSWLVLSGSPDTPGGVVDTMNIHLPDLSFTDYQGRTITFADFAGKPMVINSWAVWCPFCVKELKDFGIVQQEFGERVVFIAIDRAESLETAKKFTDQNGITGDLVFLLDSKDSFYQTIGGFSMPETIFVDKDSNIVNHKRGPMEITEIRQRVQKLFES